MGDGGRSLDYVVFGIGFGATLLVLGLLIRDFGSRLRFRSPTGADGVFHAEELVARVSWSRFCGALGTVWATAGLTFVVVTVICMVLMVSDARAGWVMGVSLLVLLAAMAFWTWAFFDRFGSYGILPERDVAVKRAAIERASAGSQEDTPDRLGEDEQDTVVDPGEMETDRIDPEPGEGVESTDEAGAPDAPSLPTPEERLASVTSPMDHDSHEAGLDTPAQPDSRPTRRSFQPAQATSGTGSDADRDSGKSGESDTDEGPDEKDSTSAGTSSATSSPLPEARPQEA